MKNAQGLLASASLALAVGTSTAQAADWIMLQGTEPQDAGLYRIFGQVWATYTSNYGCDELEGLRAPNGTPTGGTTGGPTGNNGKLHNVCVVPPEFDQKSELQLDNLMLGVRGNLIPGRINYFTAVNAGENLFNFLPFQTRRHVLATVQDASVTLSYIPGARVRAGLMKKPGPEEIQRAAPPDFVFPSTPINQIMPDVLLRSNAYSRTGTPIPGQGYAGGVSSYALDVDLGRDWGVQAFDAFKIDRWNLTYALMWGYGNGIHLRENINPHKDINTQFTAEYDLPGGKGPNKHGVKLYGYYQQGERKFEIDAQGNTSDAFDRIRYGAGVRALGELFGEGNGRHRLGFDAIFGEGMLFYSPAGNVVEGAVNNGVLGTAAEQGNKSRGFNLEYGYYLGEKWQFDARLSQTNVLYDTSGIWQPWDERKINDVTLGVTYYFTPMLKLAFNYQFRDYSAPNAVQPTANTAAAINNAAVQTSNQDIVTDSVGDRIAMRLSWMF
ncbi:MAG TPA: hypothetical protein VN279_15005 [Rhodocyclaceae bacterium]|nr:hypothetical protein [Rhodocyclaceae bacterium]